MKLIGQMLIFNSIPLLDWIVPMVLVSPFRSPVIKLYAFSSYTLITTMFSGTTNFTTSKNQGTFITTSIVSTAAFTLIPLVLSRAGISTCAWTNGTAHRLYISWGRIVLGVTSEERGRIDTILEYFVFAVMLSSTFKSRTIVQHSKNSFRLNT